MASKSKDIVVIPPPEEDERRASASPYDPAMNDRVFDMALLGATNETMAERLGVNIATFYRWMGVHQGFRDALEAGKVEANAKVARAIFKRATGYEYHEEEITKIRGADGVEQIAKTLILKHMPPDPTSGIFFLANRDKKNWMRNPMPDPEKPAEAHRRDYTKVSTEDLQLARKALEQAGEEKLPEKGALN